MCEDKFVYMWRISGNSWLAVKALFSVFAGVVNANTLIHFDELLEIDGSLFPEHWWTDPQKNCSVLEKLGWGAEGRVMVSQPITWVLRLHIVEEKKEEGWLHVSWGKVTKILRR